LWSSTHASVARALLALPGVATGLITPQPADQLPPDIVARLAGHYRVADPLRPEQLAPAVAAFQRAFGRVDRLVGLMEHVQEALAQVRDRLGIEGLSGAAARRFRDKHEMKATLRAAGLPVARQALVGNAADLERFGASVGWPVIVKPTRGVGSAGTLRVDGPAAVGSAIAQLRPSPGAPLQAEAFIDGSEHSFEAACIGGRMVWASSVAYGDRPLDILRESWKQWCVVLPGEGLTGPAAAFAPQVGRALSALGLVTGMAHMEWFLTRDGPVISEVGARPPGAGFMDMLSAAHDADAWAAWAKLVALERWELPPRRYAVGTAYLRAQGPGQRVVAVHGLEDAQRRMGRSVVAARLPRVGAPRSAHYEGDGWVMVRAATTAAVWEALGALVRTVRVVAG
jgi:hypothetical protein